MLIHVALLVAVQLQLVDVVTLTLCAAPAAGAESVVGDTV
jgi:hypothetical protein